MMETSTVTVELPKSVSTEADIKNLEEMLINANQKCTIIKKKKWNVLADGSKPCQEGKEVLQDYLKYHKPLMEVISQIVVSFGNQNNEKVKQMPENPSKKSTSEEIEELKAELVKKDSIIENVSDEIKTLKENKKSLLEKQTLLNKQIEKFQKVIDDNNKTMLQHQKELENVQQEKEKLKVETTGQTLQNDSDLKVENPTEYQKKISELEAKVTDLNNKKQELEKKIKETEEEGKKELQIARSQKTAEISKLKDQLTSAKNGQETQEKKIKTLEERNKKLEKESKEETVVSQNKTTVEKIEMDISLEEQLKISEEEKEKEKSKIVELKRKHETQETQIKDLKEQLDNKEKEKNEMEDNIKQLKKCSDEMLERNNIQHEQHKKISKQDDLIGKLQSNERELNSQIDKLKKENSELKDKKDKHAEEVNKLSKQLEEVKLLKPAIQNNPKEKQDEVTRLKKEVEQLSERLSKEMNTKVAGNESALENISIMCRPMNVASDYEVLCSNDWLEAKTHLSDHHLNDEDASVVLKDVLMIASTESSAMHQSVMQFQAHLLDQPVQVVGDIVEGNSKTGQLKEIVGATKPVKISDSLQNDIGDHFRLVIDKVNLQHLNQRVKKAISKKHSKHQKHFDEEDMKKYTLAAVSLAWKMAIQRPPMTFSIEGVGEKWKDDGRLEPSWGSEPSKPGALVRYYVNPILCHGKNTMSKGKVFVN